VYEILVPIENAKPLSISATHEDADFVLLAEGEN
jgi:hypothetical protein